MIRKIIILGATGNCIDILDTIKAINNISLSPRFKCIGFLDDDAEKWGKIIFKVPVVGGIDLAKKYEDTFFINGIGNPSTFHLKKEIIACTNIPIERFQTIIHPTASVSPSATLGNGVVIFQNATVTTNVIIKNHVIILPNTVISHDCIIGEYTSIAGGVIVSGNVTVGESCYLGANSSIIQGAAIGNQCLIGMGSVVLEDVSDNSVVVGNPAKFLRSTA